MVLLHAVFIGHILYGYNDIGDYKYMQTIISLYRMTYFKEEKTSEVPAYATQQEPNVEHSVGPGFRNGGNLGQTKPFSTKPPGR